MNLDLTHGSLVSLYRGYISRYDAIIFVLPDDGLSLVSGEGDDSKTNHGVSGRGEGVFSQLTYINHAERLATRTMRALHSSRRNHELSRGLLASEPRGQPHTNFTRHRSCDSIRKPCTYNFIRNSPEGRSALVLCTRSLVTLLHSRQHRLRGSC